MLASPALAAQCRLCVDGALSPGTAENLPPPQIEVDTNLSFGGLLLAGTTSGDAILRPDGTASVSGGLAGLSGQRMAGIVRVRGQAGRAVRIELPQRVELFTVSGDTVVIEEILSDLPRLPRLDSAGVLVFRFGGRLKVTGDADGEYRGDLPITVDYL